MSIASSSNKFTWLRRIGLGCIVVTLFIVTIIHKWLPPEQRELRRQLNEAVTLLAAKPTREISPPHNFVAKNRDEELAARKLLAHGMVKEFVAEFSLRWVQYERFESNEDALQPYLDAIADAPGLLIPKFDAAVADVPSSTAAKLLRGIFLEKRAFVARGADMVSRTPGYKFDDMTILQRASSSELLRVVKDSPRPTPAVVSLLNFSRTYAHTHIATQLFDEAVRIDPQSAALFDEYIIHHDGKWGRRSIRSNGALIAKAKQNGVSSIAIDETTRLLSYVAVGRHASTRAADALVLAKRYVSANDNYDAWLWLSRVERDQGRLLESIESLKKAAAHQPTEDTPLIEMAYAFEQLSRPDEALAIYRQAAAMGSNDGERRLIDGHTGNWFGLKRDWQVIRALCEASAEKLNAAGEFCLGGLYFHALAEYPRDATIAVSWFRRAAEKHHTTAQHDLGWMLVNGMGGLAVNREEGIYLLRQSALKNFEKAHEKLKSLDVPLTPASHTWWQIEQTAKRNVSPWFWQILDRLPAF